MSFGRRTWDREEYAKKAQLRRQKSRTPTDDKVVKKSTISRDSLSFDKDLNKRQIITGSVLNTRGRSFGFYCDVCNLTFKDNLKFVDHLNTKPHLINSGEFNNTKKEVTLEDVKAKYDAICRRLDGIKEDRIVQEKKEVVHSQNTEHTPEQDEMNSLMGFKGFSSTKK
jgi:U4/U6.U5 tri-snRNP component SNU23